MPEKSSTPRSAPVSTRQQTGRQGEILAATALRESGYTVIAQNYRCRQGEVDIIARDATYLVFVEVKARRSKSHGLPEESVNTPKRRKIREVARQYLASHPAQSETNIRFDVVAIQFSELSPRISIIKDAF